MAEVVWRRAALAELNAAIAYIDQYDPAAAERIGDRLLALGESLASFPHRGRPAQHGTRELTSVPPYVLTYVVEDDEVHILSIRHGRRAPQP